MIEIMGPEWISPNPEDCLLEENRDACDLLAIKDFLVSYILLLYYIQYW